MHDSAVSLNKPAVLDMSLLRGVCELPEQQREGLLCVLTQSYRLVVTEILIEELFIAYVGGRCDGKIGKFMMDVLVHLYPNWAASPLELIFRQFILKRDIRTDLKLPPQKASLLLDALRNPDALRPEAAQWLSDRRKEKDERLQARREYQAEIKKAYGETEFHFQNQTDFMERAIKRLCVQVDPPPVNVQVDSKFRMGWLARYLGRNLKSRHPESAALIEKAFSEATFDSLDQIKFTRNYLLAEILYDLAPITKIADQYGIYQFTWPQKSGKQINDEEDQQYVAACLLFHRLLTCDEKMHFIANLFAQTGVWRGKSIHIPRGKIGQLEDFLA